LVKAPGYSIFIGLPMDRDVSRRKKCQFSRPGTKDHKLWANGIFNEFRFGE
jgi:hypothetical protein